MTRSIRITVGSDIHYEELVGEIYCDDVFVCRIAQEQGLDRADIEFALQGSVPHLSMPLATFQKAVADVMQRLLDLRRDSQES
jgi:hypothetical protein